MRDETRAQSQPSPTSVPSPVSEAEPAAAFTPGPWRVSTDREKRDIIASACVVATAGNMGCANGYPQSERRPHVLRAQANANLIAASPDLLAACQAMVCMYEGNSAPGDLTPILLARAAIARALGQTPEGQ